MKLYAEDKQYKLFNGDMKDMLEVIEPNSIDAIVCDPPYELNFMSKGWDNSGIAFNKDAWRKCYEVLKSGGYLLAFGGTRTYHRIACAIEDAGFEIRDCLMYLYGSGFPKSHNVGLAVDKKLGCSDRGHRVATASRFHPDGTFEPNGESLPPYEGRTDEGKKWTSYGTALKPAYEPIIMARKPIEGTVADNVLKYGVGGINIDECRVGDEEKIKFNIRDTNSCSDGWKRPWMQDKDKDKKRQELAIEKANDLGRFPANVITDGSDEVKANMPDTKSEGGCKRQKSDSMFNLKQTKDDFNFHDEGSACRYFYCAKASKKDRDEGLEQFDQLKVNDGRKKEIDNAFQRGSTPRRNIHPTVKPIDLMQYLIRLVLPKGGTLLDCFMGSGSTGKACMFENRERNANYYFIGIELTDEYLPICKARIDYAINKYEYDLKQKEAETGQMNLFDFGE